MLIKIHDPKKPGDYLMVAERDFNPSVHRRFDEKPATTAPESSQQQTSTPPADNDAAVLLAKAAEIAAMSVKDAAAAIAQLPADLLEAVATAEAAGRDRVGVTKAIEERRAALTA